MVDIWVSTVNIFRFCCTFKMFHNKMLEKNRYAYIFKDFLGTLRFEEDESGTTICGGGGQRELGKRELWGPHSIPPHQLQLEHIQFHLFFILEFSVDLILQQ